MGGVLKSVENINKIIGKELMPLVTSAPSFKVMTALAPNIKSIEADIKKMESELEKVKGNFDKSASSLMKEEFGLSSKKPDDKKKLDALRKAITEVSKDVDGEVSTLLASLSRAQTSLQKLAKG